MKNCEPWRKEAQVSVRRRGKKQLEGQESTHVRVGSSVGHGQEVGLVVLQLEVLVGELGTVDALAAGSVTSSEVTSLEHEAGDDSVEGGALVSEAGLAGAELSEVLRGLWHDAKEEGRISQEALSISPGKNKTHLSKSSKVIRPMGLPSLVISK